MVFGQSQMALRIFLSLISAGHCLFFYFIAKRLFGGKISALLTAATLALHPSLIALVFTGTSEGLFLFLHAWFLCSLSSAFEQQAARKFWLSGMLLGLTTLCRAVSLLLPVFMLPLFAAIKRISGSVLFTVCCFLSASLRLRHGSLGTGWFLDDLFQSKLLVEFTSIGLLRDEMTLWKAPKNGQDSKPWTP